MTREEAAAQNTARGMFWMLVSCAAFTILWATLRALGETLHPFIQFFGRTLFGTLFLMPFMFRAGLDKFRTPNMKIHLLRGAISTCAGLCTFWAVTKVPLADLTAISYAGPLFASAGAVLFLGEKVRARRIAALVLGVVGVLIMIRPGFHEVTGGIWIGLLGSMLVGIVMLIMKKTSATDAPQTIAIYGFLFALPGTALAASLVWRTPTLHELLLLMGTGVMTVVGQTSLGRAFHYADATAVMPLDFTRLIGAVLLGWLLFGETPDGWTLLGGGIVFASTLYVAHRERVRAIEEKALPPKRTEPDAAI